ncbi:MAG TPA: endonuclease III [Patescibacteria group bacterium]|nr:endonuclease III [Patescibacteria group bacterium]
MRQVITILKREYPNARIVLTYSNHWELLVAVILSAQCTDKMVNRVTRELFVKYKKKGENEHDEIERFASTPLSELEKDIRQTGFYRNKAKNIKSAANLVLTKFRGKIPQTMDELLTLPGVARKTANVVLGNAFGVVEGIAVDTHVKRLSLRLGMTKQTNPDKIEKDLMNIFDKKDWFKLTYLLIEHGRNVCDAKKPRCDMCVLSRLCPSAFSFAHFQRE